VRSADPLAGCRGSNKARRFRARARRSVIELALTLPAHTLCGRAGWRSAGAEDQIVRVVTVDAARDAYGQMMLALLDGEGALPSPRLLLPSLTRNLAEDAGVKGSGCWGS